MLILQRNGREGNQKLKPKNDTKNCSQIEVLTSPILIDKMSANWENGMIQKKGGEEKKETFFDICKGG